MSPIDRPRRLTSRLALILLIALTATSACAASALVLLATEEPSPAATDRESAGANFFRRAGNAGRQFGDWLASPRIPHRFIARVQRAFQRVVDRFMPRDGTRIFSIEEARSQPACAVPAFHVRPNLLPVALPDTSTG